MSKKINIAVYTREVVNRQLILYLLKNEPDLILTPIHEASELVTPDTKPHFDGLLIHIPGPDSEEITLFRQIRKNKPDMPVIVMSPLNKTGANVTIAALRQGAVDYITIPEKDEALVFARRHLKKRLAPAIRNIRYMNMEQVSHRDRSIVSPPPPPSNILKGRVPVELVAVSSDTGGIRSLFTLIAGIPRNLPIPLVIIQHMPKIYTAVLAELLGDETGLPVREITYGMRIRPGTIYLAPGGFHTITSKEGATRYFHLHRGPREHEFRPSIDVTLRSLSNEFRERLLSVILSGGGKDGISGVRAVLSGGGQTIVQDQETSLLWHLPGQALRLDPSVSAVPLNRLGSEILRRVILKRSGRSRKDTVTRETRELNR